MRDATGKYGSELFQEWAGEMFLDYTIRTKDVIDFEERGNILVSEGTTNIHPVWSPNEEKFAYLSNQKNDYFGQTDLFIYSFLK